MVVFYVLSLLAMAYHLNHYFRVKIKNARYNITITKQRKKMDNVISLCDERTRREQIELDGLERLVKDLVKDIDIDSLSQPYFNPLELEMGYTYIQPIKEVAQLDTIITKLMNIVIDLDEIGHGAIADKVSEVVADVLCIHENV